MIKAIFFDLDNTIYDTRKLAEASRKNAISAIIEAGLDVDQEQAYEKLRKIVSRFGSNYDRHFDELLKELGMSNTPHLTAAAVVSYHATKMGYLVPFPDTIPTLLSLRENGIKLGVITDGLKVKQWEKLIKLGLQHFFHVVVISGKDGSQKPDTSQFLAGLSEVGVSPKEAMMVGDRLDRDILGANLAGMISVQIIKSPSNPQIPKSEREEPDYIISSLSEILTIVEKENGI